MRRPPARFNRFSTLTSHLSAGFSRSTPVHSVGFEFCRLGLMIRRTGVPAELCMSGKKTR